LAGCCPRSALLADNEDDGDIQVKVIEDECHGGRFPPLDRTLSLIPDDDPELAAFNVEVGLNAIRSGQNVYFRHVSRNVAAGPT
jgi:hypothetical protein